MNQSKKIAVLMGGLSHEREVSLRTGQAISTSLKGQGFQVVDVDVGLDIDQKLRAIKPDIAFIALHGHWGEDGVIQSLLELLKIPYTGSGPAESALAFDKEITRKLVTPLGVAVAEAVTFHRGDDYAALSQTLFGTNRSRSLELPLIVKPTREGSTIGITRVQTQAELEPAIQAALQFDSKILIEKYIKGREITVSVLNGSAHPPLEIQPKGGFYDYESKYTKGKTEYIVPARISQKLTEHLQRESEKIFRCLNFSGVIRIDYMVEGESPFFLEVNTIPGMTNLSLVPMMAKAVGLSFDQLVLALLETASLKKSEGVK